MTITALIVSGLFLPPRFRITTHIPRTAVCCNLQEYPQGGLVAPSMTL
jgi:hypothetical protein